MAVERVAGGFLVDVSAEGSGLRTLRPLPERGGTLEVEAEQQEFAPTAKDGWEESDLSAFIEDLVVDVAGIAREALVLALPGAGALLGVVQGSLSALRPGSQPRCVRMRRGTRPTSAGTSSRICKLED